MLDGWPHAPADGVEVAAGSQGDAGILTWAVVERDRSAAPMWDAERRLLFVGDVRLYNRDELTSSLGISANEMSDLGLAWLGYLHWGQEVLSHLAGDFAFAVWNDRDRSLFAARDHLGVRPLHYRIERNRILVASDVGQILSVAERPLEIETQTILERFVGPPRSQDLTYFKGINRLPGGYCMTIDGFGVHRRRYWVPTLGNGSGLSYGDHCDRIREVFKRAVRARLESERPIVAHSSGGFDSSTILMAANEIYVAEPVRPLLTMASAITPGMPCDDSQYMDAVDRAVRFERIRWNALDPRADDLYDQHLAYPGLRSEGLGGGKKGDLALARQTGSRVLISGVMGDTVLHASGVLRDMVRGGEWAEVLRHTVGYSATPFRLTARALLGYLPPSAALWILSVHGNRSSHRAHRWMGSRLRAFFPLAPPQLEVVSFPSHLTTELWARISSPEVGRGIGAMVSYGISEGLEVRLPFTDFRLIETILEVPWQQRLPRGDARRLGRDSLGVFLPTEFERRADQGSWLPVFESHARRMHQSVGRLLDDADWVSTPYVSRDIAYQMYLQSASGDMTGGDVMLLTEFAILEAWLRQARRSVGCAV